MTGLNTIACPNCKAQRPSTSGTCPVCAAGLTHVSLTTTVESNVRIVGKQFRPGVREDRDHPAIRELILGDDLFRKTGEWRSLWRLIDRLENWYSKIVRDKKTGEIVYRCEEPLDQHRKKRSIANR